MCSSATALLVVSSLICVLSSAFCLAQCLLAMAMLNPSAKPCCVREIQLLDRELFVLVCNKVVRSTFGSLDV